MRKLRVEVANRQDKLAFDADSLVAVLKGVLSEACPSAELSVAVVGDEEMRVLNRRFLNRDRPTDVLAFAYTVSGDHVEGEVVVNAEEALRQGSQRAHGPEDELLLYAVHGALHVLGWDDSTPEDRRRMHKREREILAACGRALDS
jgi:probable rRNA maturation factor